MTSISNMTARCPSCQADLLQHCLEEEALGIGDSEDTAWFDCPTCSTQLHAEITARIHLVEDNE